MLRKLSVGLHHGLATLLLVGVLMSCGGGGGSASNSANPTYTLSGMVTGIVPQGVTITLSGAGTGTTTTSAAGTYSFTGLSNGYYTVTAARANYKFTPASQAVAINYANAAATTIVSENAYGISGHVADGSTVATAGVTMTLTGLGLASSLTATTDASGNYTYSAVPGDYTVTPSKNSQYDAVLHTLTTYSFSPPSKPVTISNANFPGVDFVTTVTTTNAYNISGKIIPGTQFLTTDPFILVGVTVGLYNSGSVILITTTTDASGNYAFNGIPNGSYTVSPYNFRTGSCPVVPTEYSFSPVSSAITISVSNLTVDFVENISRGGCVSPI